MQSDSKYDFKKDKTLRSYAITFFGFLLIFAASSKLAEKVVEKYLLKGETSPY